MSAAQKRRSVDKEERRARRRRRKTAAAASTVLLVAAAVAGEPAAGFTAGPAQAASGVGGGLFGMTDPEDVSANGEVGEDDRIGDEVLKSADDLDRLLQLAAEGDLPTGQQGLPGVMAEAYRSAANRLATEQPNCKLHWSLLASIGRIESHHANGGRVDSAGNTVPNILGPVLNGGGFAAIQDTDGGRLDGDNRWDRAVGAMQFIPSTWRGYAADGNNDGVESPHNVWDATLAAGKYLCSGDMDLSNPRDLATAVFRYNNSDTYVATVILWAKAYRNGTPILPSEPIVPDVRAMGPPSSIGGPAPKPSPSKPPASKPGTPGGGPVPSGAPTTTTTTPGRTTIPGPGTTTSSTTRPTQTTVPCSTSSTTTSAETTLSESSESVAGSAAAESSAPTGETGAAGSAVSSTVGSEETTTSTTSTTTTTPPTC